jgi:hypothetical protein
VSSIYSTAESSKTRPLSEKPRSNPDMKHTKYTGQTGPLRPLRPSPYLGFERGDGRIGGKAVRMGRECKKGDMEMMGMRRYSDRFLGTSISLSPLSPYLLCFERISYPRPSAESASSAFCCPRPAQSAAATNAKCEAQN